MLHQQNMSAGIQIPAPASVMPVVPATTDMHHRASNGALRKQKIKHNTTLIDLIHAGMLTVGQTLCFIRSSPPMLGVLQDDGTILAEFDEAKYTTIGGFAIAAHRSSGGAGKGIDGWRTVKPKDQNMYLATLRAKYEEQHKGAVSYVPASGDSGSFGGNRKLTRRDGDAPKKPLCAFVLYVQTVRGSILETNPMLSGGQLLRRIGQQWTELPEHERQPFMQLEANQNDRYQMIISQPGGGALRSDGMMQVPEMAIQMPAVSIPVMGMTTGHVQEQVPSQPPVHEQPDQIPNIVMPVAIPPPQPEQIGIPMVAQAPAPMVAVDQPPAPMPQ